MLGIELKTARHTWTAALVLLCLGVIYLVRQTLFVFILSLLFAYLLYPLFDAICRFLKAKNRIPALALTYLLVIAFIVAFVMFLGNRISGEAGQLTDQIRDPGFAAKMRQFHLWNIPVGDLVATHYQEIVSRIPSATLKVLAVSTNLIYLAVIPILSFFILKDGRQIRDGFLEMLDHGRQTADDTLNDAHTLLLQYMRALLFLCLSTLIVFSIALSAMGVRYAILLAAIAFPLEFIPLVGPLTAAIVILSVTAFSGGPVVSVFIFLGVFRIFQDYVLSPNLMSQGVELHPLFVIFGVFAGGEIGGVEGVFLSIPVLALLRLLYFRLRKSRVLSAEQVLPR
jgi:predicted PurR-regulated permease PerM